MKKLLKSKKITVFDVVGKTNKQKLIDFTRQFTNLQAIGNAERHFGLLKKFDEVEVYYF